ncbi:MAG: Uma2 family endonuclease [Burkholderiaceae bacterium]
MSAVVPRPGFDAAAYLAWEAAQEVRHEYVAGEVFAMTGSRLAHNIIVLNAAVFLRQALKGKPCRVFMADLKLRIDAADAFVYPDVMVSCDPRDRKPDDDTCIRHPWMVLEVLSASTAAYDRGRKFELYRQVATLSHYLLVEQDRRGAELFRKNDDGLWVLQPLVEADTLHIAEHGIDWPIATLHDDVDFGPTAAPS